MLEECVGSGKAGTSGDDGAISTEVPAVAGTTQADEA
jgi:hypothetical protein